MNHHDNIKQALTEILLTPNYKQLSPAPVNSKLVAEDLY